ncbi:hypothetical protein MMC07_007908 [Pseudocyphellaria aurata]|nr:hypothetical protein [Pseudocyphellaria aurata]
MNTHPFVFPPPPPPPPVLASSNQVNPPGPPNGHKYGYNNKGIRGDRASRGSRGRGQSASKQSSRGGSFGALSVPAHTSYTQQNNSPFLPQDVYHPPANKPGSSYPLPEYPPVQQPQYPATFASYSRSAATTATYPAASITSPSPHPEYYSHTQAPLQYQNGQPRATPNNFNSLSQNVLHYPRGPQQYSPAPSRPEPPKNPQLMGPPLRMGFNNGYPGASQQIQAPSQRQPSLPSMANSLQHGTRPFMRPSFQANPPSIPSSNKHDSPMPFTDHRSRGQRRHHDGPGSQRRFNTKSQVAPAVPSFGNPLPVKPPAPQEMARRPKKKKRRHNQLGLTPRNLEHESSEEEENDGDEESKLAVAAGLPDSARPQLQFSYRGRTSILQSSSDIAAWLEERKKRFPTKARMDEQKESLRQLQENQRAATQLLIEARAKQKAEGKEKKKSNIHGTPNGSCTKEQKLEPQETDKEASIAPNDVAAKAKLKVEKLRRRLEKEERRVAKAEARASRLKIEANDSKAKRPAPGTSEPVKKRKRSESVASGKGENGEEAREIKPDVVALPETEAASAPQQGHETTIKKEDNNIESGRTEFHSLEHKAHVLSTISHDPLTPTSQPSVSEASEPEPERTSVQPSAQPSTNRSDSAQPHEQMPNSEEQHGFHNDQSYISSNISLSSSSSSSLSLSADSDDESTSSEGSTSSSSPSGPESRSIKQTQPDKVSPPKRRHGRLICRYFLQNGHCRKGDGCRFRHELPERGSRLERRTQGKREGKKPRIGLYQRLVEQEKQTQEKEDQQEKRAKLEREQEKHDLEVRGADHIPMESAKEMIPLHE